jgi:integrase
LLPWRFPAIQPTLEKNPVLLNVKTVAMLSLPDGKADVIHFDDEMPGFGLRLRRGAGGRVLRSWVAQYRRAGGTRRVLLGSAGVLSAAQAREAAKAMLAKVALGEDPQADKVAARAKDRISLKSIVTDYLAMKRDEVRPNSFRQIEAYLIGPHFRPLHNMPIDLLTQRDVASCLVTIIRERGNTTGARSALSAMFVWAMQQGLTVSNPVVGTRKPSCAPPRERVLSDPELVAIWQACRDDDFGRIVKLLILLGSRRDEVGGMCWSELDGNGSWTLPAARSKNERAHTLPLPALAADIIASVLRIADRDQLFGERSARGFANWSKAKRLLDARCGVRDWTLHDIRRSVATGMADIGIQPHLIEQILNHQSGHKRGVAGIYNRSRYSNEVATALTLWADHVEALVEGEFTRKIVALHPR